MQHVFATSCDLAVGPVPQQRPRLQLEALVLLAGHGPERREQGPAVGAGADAQRRQCGRLPEDGRQAALAQSLRTGAAELAGQGLAVARLAACHGGRACRRVQLGRELGPPERGRAEGLGIDLAASGGEGL